MPRAPKHLPSGFRCIKCDRFNRFATWVYAHWTIPLVFTCDCGTKYNVLEGTATKA